MKRLIALFCVFALTLTLFGCGPELNVEQGEEDEVAETKAEEKLDASKISYPKGFSVGYAREDVTPEETPIIINGTDKATTIKDPVQLTCTAMCDGENVFLLMSVDLRGVPETFVKKCKKIITDKVGVPAENIFLNATHTHHAPDNEQFDKDAVIIRWQKMFYQKLERAVVGALLDLAPAEVFVGTGKVEGVTFVRRFVMPDGTYAWNTTKPEAQHESEADDELRMIRFDRGNEKDVLLVNYQTHYASDSALNGKISANFIHDFREKAEKDLDVHFAYHQGAGGNVNFNSPVPGKRLYKTYKETIPVFMGAVKTAMESETKVETGTIKVSHNVYKATVWEVDAQRAADARAIMDISSPMQRQTAMKEKGFAEEREVRGILSRQAMIEKGETSVDMPFTAVSIGDIAFAAAPYEMFDTNGVEIRNASPFKMTFICAYTNGHMGYIPSALAFPHGGYEVYVCKYRPGSGEELANELVRLLNECK